VCPFLLSSFSPAFAQVEMLLLNCSAEKHRSKLALKVLLFIKDNSSVVFFYNYFFQYVKERFKPGMHEAARLLLFPLYGLNVENNGFEPLTPCVQGRCSSQLS